MLINVNTVMIRTVLHVYYAGTVTVMNAPYNEMRHGQFSALSLLICYLDYYFIRFIRFR